MESSLGIQAINLGNTFGTGAGAPPNGQGEEWHQAHERVGSATGGWQSCAIVDHRGTARVRRHPTHKYRDAAAYIVPGSMAKGLHPNQRPFPLAQQAPTTERPPLPQTPPEWLKREVKNNLRSWEDCLMPNAKERLQRAVAKASKDESVLMASPGYAHRQRAKCGARDAEVRIGPDEYHPIVNAVLRNGYSLDLTRGGIPEIRELQPLGPREWGINAEQLIQDARARAWPDEELLFFLEYGFMDYSGLAPPVSSFSPHQQKALRDWPTFREQVQQEIDKQWIGPARYHPPSIPFQVRPGSLEPKSEGRSRLVWNASWPAPGSFASAAKIGGEWFPLAPNDATILPSILEFKWSAIETNNEVIEIMAEGAKAAKVPILGRTFDIAKWFRQLGVANLDVWKSTVYFEGGFREDKRMQMGRRSSAHSAQRTTFLLIALLQQAACEERWGTRLPGQCNSESEALEQKALSEWLTLRDSEQERTAVTAPSPKGGNALVGFSSFQDDITAIALGKAAAQDATAGVLRVLQGRYGVPLSTKKEASKDFSSSFTSIGASYDLKDPYKIVCKPRAEKLQKYRSMPTALERPGKLLTIKEMQRFAGLHTFMARFLPDGEFYCNSAYCCLRATPHTREDLRPVSVALMQDATTVLHLLQRGSVAPLTADPIFAHPGLQGFSADASGASGVEAGGWGVHVMGKMAYGRWSADIRQALKDNQLSISPLELLAAAIALKGGATHAEALPAGRQLVLRNDSQSACAVVNSMRADSAPMLEALRIWKEVQDDTVLKALLQYIPSAQNRIADCLSRNEVGQAARHTDPHFDACTVDSPPRVQRWCARILQAAVQAARHTGDTASQLTAPAHAKPDTPGTPSSIL